MVDIESNGNLAGGGQFGRHITNGENKINMRITIIVFLIFTSLTSGEQNLVPNSGFESYRFYKKGHYLPDQWICVSSSPLFIIAEKDSAFGVGSYSGDGEINHCDKYPERSSWTEPTTSNCLLINHTEAVGCFLLSNLQKDTLYYIEFYLTSPRSINYYSKYIGAFLTRGRQDFRPSGKLLRDIEPAISSEVFPDNPDKWFLVSGLYKAKGGEDFITIGRTMYPTDYSKCRPNELSDIQLTTPLLAFLIDNVKLMRYSFYIDSLSNKLVNEKKLVFSDINFSVGSSEIESSSFFELDKLADILKKVPERKILISGHTDNTGTMQSNQELSANRAKSVVDYLVTKGVDRSRLQYKGFGSTKPVASNETEAGKAKNRRVEIEIID